MRAQKTSNSLATSADSIANKKTISQTGHNTVQRKFNPLWHSLATSTASSLATGMDGLPAVRPKTTNRSVVQPLRVNKSQAQLPIVQRQTETLPESEVEEEAPLVQRQLGDSEEDTIQRQAEEPEEDTIQRQAEEPEEDTIQRQAEEPEEDTIQRQSEESPELAEEQEGSIQTSLQVGSPDDEQEKEADSVADRVMRQQRGSQTEELAEPEELPVEQQDNANEDAVQAKSNAHKGVPEVTSQVHNTVNSPGPGTPLHDSVRAQVEPVLQTDLAHVRVHNDAQADVAAKSLNAKAFTHGSNIWLASTQSPNDTRLMAHESTHVVQQGAADSVQRRPLIQRAWYHDLYDTGSKGVSWLGGKARWVGGKAVGAVKGGIKAVLKLAARLAREIPGYKLLTLIINRDPITGASVDRGQLLNEIVPRNSKLAKHVKLLADSAGKVLSWVDKQFTSADFTWSAIKKAFSRTVDSLKWHDIAVPPKAAYKIIENFVIPVAKRALKFAANIAKDLFGMIFRWLLEKSGPHAKTIMGLIGKVGSVLRTIAKDPIGFAKNLAKAFELGFSQFRAHFLAKHLPSALAGLIFGPLKITIPEKLTFSNILNLTLQVMDLTYTNGLRPKLVKRLGEKRVEFIESAVSLIQQVRDKGIGVLWDKVQQFMGNLKELVVDKLKSWLITRVVIAGVKWIAKSIAKLIVPGGAILSAIEGVYAFFKVFMDRWEQIKTVISNIADSIGRIAAGKIGPAAIAIEKVLAKGLSLLIAFLANLLGLGGIGDKVREIIMAIKERIHAAMDRLVGYIINLVGKLFGKAKFALGKALQWWRRRRSIRGGDRKTYTVSISGGEKSPEVMVRASPKKRFSSFINARKSKMTTTEQKEAMKVAEQQVKIVEHRRKKPGETEAQIAGIKLNAFNTLADQLLIMTGGTKTPISVFTFGGLNVDQGGSEMTASILSKDHPGGSAVTDKPYIWTDLYHMRKGVGAPYYVQGHLLNSGLGGPGKRYNLSPLTTRANKDHFDHVEKNIKTWVNKKNINMYYHVKVNYPSLSDTARLKALREKDEAIRTTAEKRELAVLTQQRLATSFTCNAHKLKYEGSSWTADTADSAHKISYEVKNQ